MNNNSFSWSRLAMTARYWYPALRLQIILYPVIVIVAAALSYAASLHTGLTGFNSLLNSIPGTAVMFAPLIFIHHTDRTLQTLLPASVMEKTVFFVGYSMLFIPIICYGLYELVYGVMTAIWGVTDFQTFVSDDLSKLGISQSWTRISYISNLVSPMACLYAVIALKRNRYLAALWAIVPSFVSGILGIIWVLCSGFIAGMEKMAQNGNISEDSIMEMMSGIITPMMIIISATCVVITIILIPLIYRKIKNIQI